MAWSQKSPAVSSHSWAFRLLPFHTHGSMGQHLYSISLILISSVFLLQPLLHGFSASSNGAVFYAAITPPNHNNSRGLTCAASLCLWHTRCHWLLMTGLLFSNGFFFLHCEFKILIAVSRTVKDNEREERKPEYTAGEYILIKGFWIDTKEFSLFRVKEANFTSVLFS